MAREKKSSGTGDVDIDEKNKIIASLSFQIQGLEDSIKELDNTLATHPANQTEYKQNQILLTELLKNIEDKRGINTAITVEMNDLAHKKFLAEQQLEPLEKLVAEKQGYVADIEKYKGLVIIVQREMETFQDQHASNKRIATQELEDIKSEVKKLHELIGKILTS